MWGAMYVRCTAPQVIQSADFRFNATFDPAWADEGSYCSDSFGIINSQVWNKIEL
jgi:hypothetical protein